MPAQESRPTERLRALLAEDRSRTTGRLAALRADVAGVVAASRDDNADDEHDPEGQTIAYERSRGSALVRQAEDHLRDLDRAEARLQDGTSWLCECCGEAIPTARLLARPTARRCIACASP